MAANATEVDSDDVFCHANADLTLNDKTQFAVVGTEGAGRLVHVIKRSEKQQLSSPFQLSSSLLYTSRSSKYVPPPLIPTKSVSVLLRNPPFHTWNQCIWQRGDAFQRGQSWLWPMQRRLANFSYAPQVEFV